MLRVVRATGYNHNIRHGGLVFHVQSQPDLSGQAIVSEIFFRGSVISTRRSRSPETASDEDAFKKQIQDQHRDLVRDLVRGRFDEVIAATPGTGEFRNVADLVADSPQPRPAAERQGARPADKPSVQRHAAAQSPSAGKPQQATSERALDPPQPRAQAAQSSVVNPLVAAATGAAVMLALVGVAAVSYLAGLRSSGGISQSPAAADGASHARYLVQVTPKDALVRTRGKLASRRTGPRGVELLVPVGNTVQLHAERFGYRAVTRELRADKAGSKTLHLKLRPTQKSD